jgi:hypothetical protein
MLNTASIEGGAIMNSNPRAFKMPFSDVYPLYIKKAER